MVEHRQYCTFCYVLETSQGLFDGPPSTLLCLIACMQVIGDKDEKIASLEDVVDETEQQVEELDEELEALKQFLAETSEFPPLYMCAFFIYCSLD